MKPYKPKLATEWSDERREPSNDETPSNADETPEGGGNTVPLFTDLSPYLTGDGETEKPTVASVFPDGRALLYAGRINSLHGEPSGGKTCISIGASNAVLDDGGRVLYIDPEDTPGGFARRCMGLGGDPQALAERCHYLHNPDGKAVTAAQEWAREHKPDLVILDGFAEALASVGGNEDSAGDVLRFFREWLRPFADIGAAVLVADHVTKSTEGRGRWARGSGAKLGRYDGLVLSVELGAAYTPSTAGFVRLKIAKDRNGGAGAMGETLAEVHFVPDDGHTEVSFRAPKPAGTWKPTAAMEKVKEYLASVGEDSKRGVVESIPMKRDTVLQAIAELTKSGEISVSLRGQTHLLKLAGGSSVPRSPTVPQPFPENGQGVVSNRSPVSPPIRGTENGNDAGQKKDNKAPNRSPARPCGIGGRPARFRDDEAASKAASQPPDAGTRRAFRAVVAKMLRARGGIRAVWLEDAVDCSEKAGALTVTFPASLAKQAANHYAKEQAKVFAELWREETGRSVTVTFDPSAPDVASATAATPMTAEDFAQDPGIEAAVEGFAETFNDYPDLAAEQRAAEEYMASDDFDPVAEMELQDAAEAYYDRRWLKPAQ